MTDTVSSVGGGSDRRGFLRIASKVGLTFVGLGAIVSNRDKIASKAKDILDAFDPIPSNEAIEKMIDDYVSDSRFDAYLAEVVNERAIPNVEERLFVLRCINDVDAPEGLDEDFFSEESSRAPAPSAPIVLFDRASIVQELRQHLRDIAIPVYNVNKPRAEHDAWFQMYAPGVLKARIEQAVGHIRANFQVSQVANVSKK